MLIIDNINSFVKYIYNFAFRSMKRARDVREQLVGLMQRVEMELVSGITETINIRKVSLIHMYMIYRITRTSYINKK